MKKIKNSQKKVWLFFFINIIGHAIRGMRPSSRG